MIRNKFRPDPPCPEDVTPAPVPLPPVNPLPSSAQLPPTLPSPQPKPFLAYIMLLKTVKDVKRPIMDTIVMINPILRIFINDQER